MADKESPALQRRRFTATYLDVAEEEAPLFDSWTRLFEWLGRQEVARDQDQRRILIIDELPYASQGDPAMLAALQQAWDQSLRQTNLIISLCGSQVNVMESIMQQQSPLFGRLTGQWLLKPLPFYASEAFFPGWAIDERIALYAILGGVPAYWEWLEPGLSFVENLRQVILSPGSLFTAEPDLLLYEELNELETYHAILRALSQNNHTIKEISNACLIPTSKVGFYLSKLQTLHFVERRLPATLTAAQRRNSRRGRYHLSDPYFRFYFRFVVPHLRTIRPLETTVQQIRRELRPFVADAFETLCREWVHQQALRYQLGFYPEQIGSHWSKRVQIDVVAVNFEEKRLLLGECKWQGEPVGRGVVKELVEEKLPKLWLDTGWSPSEWQVNFVCFSRNRFTPAAENYAGEQGVEMVDLSRLNLGLNH